MPVPHYRTIWSRYATIFLGLWLIAGSRSFGYDKPLIFLWNDTICAILLIFFSLIALSRQKLWAPWAMCFIGLWLQFAPLAFWAPRASIYANDTLTGVLVIAFSILIPGIPGKPNLKGPSIPPGWSFNPSSYLHQIPISLLGACAWFLSCYLAAFQLGYIDHVWDPIFGDGTMNVINSNVSKAFPISDAGLGAFAYTIETLLALAGNERRWHTMPWLVSIFGLLVIPVSIVSIILIVLQPLVIGSFCTICLCIALIMMVMIALAADEIAATAQFLWKMKKEGKFWNSFWQGAEFVEGAKDDTRTPSFDEPLGKIIRSMRWGLSISWNLSLSVVVGAAFLFYTYNTSLIKGLAYSGFIISPLIVLISVVSMSEVICKLRYINIIFASWIAISSLIFFPLRWDVILTHFFFGIVLTVLAIPYSKIKESYGNV